MVGGSSASRRWIGLVQEAAVKEAGMENSAVPAQVASVELPGFAFEQNSGA